MKKLIFIIALIFFSCKTQTNKIIAPIDKKCFTTKEEILIKKAVKYFETQLKKQYPNLEREASYFKFIYDLSTKKLDKDFFSAKIEDSLFDQIKRLKIWNKTQRTEENMQRESRLFNVNAMNPYRIKLNKEASICLIKSTKARGLWSFLFRNSKYRLSPKLIKSSIYRVSEFELKGYNNRKIIALAVYYQTAFNINQ